MRYIVPKEIKSETRVVWVLHLKDASFLILWIGATLMLKNQVHEVLNTVFVIFSILVGVLLVLPSQMNPNRKMYQSIALKYLQREEVYRYFDEGRKGEEPGEQNTVKAHKTRHSNRRV